MQFVHLGIHTEFSITESIVRVPELIKTASGQSMPAHGDYRPVKPSCRSQVL